MRRRAVKRIHIWLIGACTFVFFLPLIKRQLEGLPLVLYGAAYIIALVFAMECLAKDGRWYACWRQHKRNK